MWLYQFFHSSQMLSSVLFSIPFLMKPNILLSFWLLLRAELLFGCQPALKPCFRLFNWDPSPRRKTWSSITLHTTYLKCRWTRPTMSCIHTTQSHQPLYTGYMLLIGTFLGGRHLSSTDCCKSNPHLQGFCAQAGIICNGHVDAKLHMLSRAWRQLWKSSEV